MCFCPQQTTSLRPLWQGSRGIPQSESLARLMINIQYRTAEVLLSPHRGMEIKPKKCDRNPKGRQEVRYAHSTKEAANHSGGKGCTLYSSK